MGLLTRVGLALAAVLLVAWALALTRPATGQLEMAKARRAATIRPLHQTLDGLLASFPKSGPSLGGGARRAVVVVLYPNAGGTAAQLFATEVRLADRDSRQLAAEVLFIGIDLSQPTVSEQQGQQLSQALGLSRLPNWQPGSVAPDVLAGWLAQLQIPPAAPASVWLVVCSPTGQLHWLLREPESSSLVQPYAELDTTYALAVAQR